MFYKQWNTPGAVSCFLLAAAILSMAAATAVTAAGSENMTGLSKAYPGHGYNQDMENFLAVYPASAGGPLDDCRLCHPAGSHGGRQLNSCSFCHAVMEKSGPAPMNDYGTAYAAGGRSTEAIRLMDTMDSDGDGADNHSEIKASCYPGENRSKPGLPVMPSRRIDELRLNDKQRMSQFQLMNASKQVDYYAEYTGISVAEILKFLGLSRLSMTGITVYAVDGYQFDFTNDEIWKSYPRAIFYGPETLKSWPADCGQLIHYPSVIPPDVRDGRKIPGKPKLMLADMKDGIWLDIFNPDKKTGSRGEGSFRLIVPQKSPSPPDQSSKHSNPDCPYPYTQSLHHNAGDSVRAVVAIQIHPSPSEMNEPNWRAMAKDLLNHKEILIFGLRNPPPETP